MAHRVTDAPGKRRDVQGLRAVAVLAVVVNHLFGHPQGGFVGVDVFFVISGFLITGLLIRDLGDGTGPMTYVVTFYRRRIRRLLPAALLVVALTVVAAHWVYGSYLRDGTRYASVAHDGAWAAVFGANWHLIAVGTDYFTSSGPTSPLQHYWSLSVEEQFYLVWPIVLFGLVAMLGRRRSLHARRVVCGVAATALCAVSLAVATVQSASDPVTAYFSTFTRGWELGLGALLACVAPYLRLRTGVLTLMSCAGTALIVLSLFVVHGGLGFPVPGAVLPCAGAVLVLAATSTDGRRPRNVALTARPMVFVGDISYSIYLTHFPIIILLSAYLPRGGYHAAACLLGTLGASLALYGLVEAPILRSNWLQPRHARRDRATAARSSPRPRAFAVAAALAVSAAVLATAAWPGEDAALRRKYEAVNAAIPGVTDHGTVIGGRALPPRAAILAVRIGRALRATSWPELRSTITQSAAHPDNAFISRCGGYTLLPANQCTVGSSSATHTLYVTGDSTSMVYGEALMKVVAHAPDWKLRFAGGVGCEFSTYDYRHALATVSAECDQRKVDVVRDVRRTRPDLLVVTNNHDPQMLLDGTVVAPPDQEAAVAGELSKVVTSVGSTILLEPPPGGGDPVTCYRPDGNPVACVRSVPDSWRAAVAADRRIVRSLPRTRVVSSRAWFCNAGGYCPAFVGRVPTMRDATHSDRAYMDVIWPVLAEALHRSHILT